MGIDEKSGKGIKVVVMSDTSQEAAFNAKEPCTRSYSPKETKGTIEDIEMRI